MKVKDKILQGIITALFLAMSQTAWGAGYGFEASRVIIDRGNTDGSIVLKNSSPKNILTMSMVLDCNYKETALAESLPRLFVTKAGESSVIRINVLKEQLPDDRETLFYLYAKLFDAHQKAEVQKLKINYINRIKIFFRPINIRGSMIDAIENLQWSVSDQTLKVKNPSPLHVSMVSIDINGKKKAVNDIIEPYADWNTEIRVPAGISTLKWSAVNDYGSLVEFEKKPSAF